MIIGYFSRFVPNKKNDVLVKKWSFAILISLCTVRLTTKRIYQSFVKEKCQTKCTGHSFSYVNICWFSYLYVNKMEISGFGTVCLKVHEGIHYINSGSVTSHVETINRLMRKTIISCSSGSMGANPCSQTVEESLLGRAEAVLAAELE